MSDLQQRLIDHGVDERLRRLQQDVADKRSVTGGEPNSGYVSMRPAAWGTICAYFHKDYVDVALSPDKARRLERDHGLRIVSANSETAFVQIRVSSLDDPDVHQLALGLVLEAVDKSERGTAYEGGKSARRRQQAAVPTCPIHHELMLGGVCERCE